MCVSVLVVLMRERHTDRQTDRQTQRERERERDESYLSWLLVQ